MSRTIVLLSVAMFVADGAARLAAQQPSAANVRSEVQQAVRAYVDAVNKADAATLVEMYSREAGVTSVGDGQITRGWDAIRPTADSMARKASTRSRQVPSTLSLLALATRWR